jgi:diguanylate cyclase (GGDEF)-like protein
LYVGLSQPTWPVTDAKILRHMTTGAPRRTPPVVAAATLILTTGVVDLSAQSAAATATSLNPRVLLGAAALLITGLLSLLYFYRRRLYIRYWILAWTLAAAAPFLIAHAYTNRTAAGAMYGLSHFVGILSALVFVISADAYRTKPRLRRSYAVVLLPVLIWFALAPIAMRQPDVVHAPGHLMIAGCFTAAGIAYLALMRQTRLLGAAVVGTMMLGFAAANAWWAFGGQGTIGLSDRAIFLNLALYLAMALGMQLMTFEDMTYELRVANMRLETAQGELRDLVARDALTGCRNRRFFDEVINREIERHRRYLIPLSLLFIDVNRFKAINDTLGHDEGDRVLQRVAAFLVRNVRDADYVFRWGGDEFLVLISCALPEAERKAADLKAAFASLETATLPAGVGLSVGCAEVTPAVTDIMAVVRVADEGMYRDKRGF